MRIIAGARRGKKILEKCDTVTRPTTDRVRENAFNVLSNFIDLKGAVVLDLFAGCGAYGLESSSRGALEIVFNDADKLAAEVIKKNAKAVGCDGMVLNLDFRAALEKFSEKKFDIIFLDPPYKSEYLLEAADIIIRQNMLAKDGIIVAETENAGLQFPGLSIKRKRNYGRAWLYFLGQPLRLPE